MNGALGYPESCVLFDLLEMSGGNTFKLLTINIGDSIEKDLARLNNEGY